VIFTGINTRINPMINTVINTRIDTVINTRIHKRINTRLIRERDIRRSYIPLFRQSSKWCPTSSESLFLFVPQQNRVVDI
jgi:hypothetical protein